MDHFRQTRDIEFKVNIAIWTLIVLAGYFLYGKICLNSCTYLAWYIGISILIVGLHLVWMCKIERSENKDIDYFTLYSNQVHTLKDISKIDKKGSSWVALEVSFTIILAILFLLLLSSEPKQICRPLEHKIDELEKRVSRIENNLEIKQTIDTKLE